MIATIPQPRATLPALLAQRARHASDGRLAFDVGGGLVIAAVALVLRPPGWVPLRRRTARRRAAGDARRAGDGA